MPNITVTIGGRGFAVACSAGEEPYLQTAAQMLDAEAQVLLESGIERMTDATMLLMAGLMLADKTAGLEERIKKLEAHIEALAEQPVERVEVPVIPQQAMEYFAALAKQAESIAARAEQLRQG